MFKVSKIIIFLVFFCFYGQASANESLNGRILIETEENGEAWYVYPGDSKRYYLGRPRDAFEIMKKLSLGARHDYIASTKYFPDNLSGMILLDVERNGEAYYINPLDRMKYYLARPDDAFALMREMGLGISGQDIASIEEGNAYADTAKSLIDNAVPFTSQAPFGNWQDQRQQDGCEEASALMAVYYMRGESLSSEKALDEIIAMSDYERDRYGEYRDTSSEDMLAWIFKDYLDYHKVRRIENVAFDKLLSELEKGNLIVAPLDGQIIRNPHFTYPGPEKHMLVIRGYDYESEEFITNDPGTRHGEAYRYPADVLYRAIRDYPTGSHESVLVEEKNVIVVESPR